MKLTVSSGSAYLSTLILFKDTYNRTRHKLKPTSLVITTRQTDYHEPGRDNLQAQKAGRATIVNLLRNRVAYHPAEPDPLGVDHVSPIVCMTVLFRC